MSTQKVSFYTDKFYGMNTRLDPDKLFEGFSPLAVNVDLTRMKTVSKRQGTKLFGQAFSAKEMTQSVIELIDPSGIPQAFVVRGGTVYKYSEATNTLGVSHAGVLTPGINVPSVTFKNRVYLTSEKDFLGYTDGTTYAVVGENNNRIKGKCLAVGQRTLFIGNVEVNSVKHPDRVYYSDFDIDTVSETDRFWNDFEEGVEGNLLNSTRFFRVEGGVVRAMASFANRDRVYVFSDTRCYAFNVDQAITNPFGALQEVFPIGCAGPNAVTVTAGVMYWMDNNAKVYAWTGNTARPEEISYNIDDEAIGNSVVYSIDKSQENLTKIAAFSISKQVYFSVGSVCIADKQLKNVCIKFFLSQNGLLSYTSLDTYPERPLVGAIVRIGDENRLIVGNNANTLIMKQGLNDIDADNRETAIDAFYRTKSYNFDAPLRSKSVNNIFIQYAPTDNHSRLEILTRVSNSTEYVPIAKPDTLISYGGVDMKRSESTERQNILKVNLPVEVQGESISFEFANRSIDETFSVHGIGSFDVQIGDLNVSIV